MDAMVPVIVKTNALDVVDNTVLSVPVTVTIPLDLIIRFPDSSISRMSVEELERFTK